MKTLGLILAVASLAFFIFATAATALAQDPSSRRRHDSSAGQVTTYDFVDGSNVDGARPGPMETFLQGRRRRVRTSLIVPRPHFIPEMLKSVESM